MARTIRLLPILAVVVGVIVSPPSGRAQTPADSPEPMGKAPPKSYDYNPLPDLPRPAEAPASLLRPAPTAPPYSCDPLPGPYFERDPLWDPPELPQPGWVAALDLTALKPHVKNHLSGQPQFPGSPPDQVRLPSAGLDWTVAPRVEVGYRLPSGFGEFILGYRGFGSQGTGTFAGADGPATLTSRLDLNQVDLTYASREYSLWPNWEMKWFVGLRLSYVYFDSRADEDFAAAAAGSGVFEQRESNSYWGIGPHAGLELARHLDGTGLSFLARVDVTEQLGRVRQQFAEVSTSPDLGTATFGNSGSQAVPVLNVRAGLGWQPPQLPLVNLFLGYEYEYWWNVGRLSTTPDSRGEMSNQGITVRCAINF